ncbi:VOC family protein [Pseudoalteromonas byunsanensis]|uniref:Glyoxalase n=1 Tax=Pseudoalteromonas byunsanensis TaxID=327939 RepID=A0A1S1N929_9GAMM|nr:VOC family protein [Pseudoalteromonas byunsanensis]OHU95205.1 glyoxalase [Pseudoalteromonas byunsanensis]
MTTQGIDHLGLSVKDLQASVDFFVNVLGWEESGRDDSYPRSAVSDGSCRLTLWQVDHNLDIQEFDRRKNIGLHHVAFQVATYDKLMEIYNRIQTNDITLEFEPEPLKQGPRQHFICYEPGGLRVEFIWNGN